MRRGIVITESLIISIVSLVIGFYIEKETKVTNYIYQSDANKTVILWVKSDKSSENMLK